MKKILIPTLLATAIIPATTLASCAKSVKMDNIYTTHSQDPYEICHTDKMNIDKGQTIKFELNLSVFTPDPSVASFGFGLMKNFDESGGPYIS